MKKRVLSVFLILCLLLAAMPFSAFAADEVTAQWKNFRNSDGNMAITEAATPIAASSTELKWTLKADAVGGWPTISPQLIVDGYMITSLNQELCKVDLETGTIVDKVTMGAMPDYGNTPMTFGEGLIYVPLGNGTVEAYDAKTLTKEWAYSDALGGQSQSPITYADGYIYTGFWVGKTSDANYVCLDAKTGQLQWSYTVKGGFYWAGSVEVGDFVVVGTDDGTTDATGTARLLAFKKTYGEQETIAPMDTLDLIGCDDVHSSIAYGNGSLYFTTTAGYLCLAVINPDTGEFTTFKKVDHGASSTSTPIVYSNEVYFGVNDGAAGSYFVAANAATLEEEYKVEMKAYPQCSFLLSTAYDDGLYFYGTYNSLPGGITLIKADPENNTAEATEVYTPEEANQQYCISSIICDSEGTLYYKNDSGNIFAVGSTEQSGGNQDEEDMEDEEGNLDTDSIEVYVSIAKDGQFVKGADDEETMVANAKVNAKDRNADGKVNVDEVLAATHETYHPDKLGGYASATGQYGLGITKLWGDTSGAYGYYNNDASCWSLDDEVKDGDYVKAYIYKDQTTWSDKYTTFEEEEYSVKEGETTTVKLMGAGYDENWNMVFTPYEGAKISVNGEATDYVTDAKGQVTLTFDKAGTYKVVAYYDGASSAARTAGNAVIVPSVCTVTVTENGAVTPDIDKTDTDSAVTDTPKTGDSANIQVWIGLMVLMAAVAAGVYGRNKREE